MTHIHQRKGEAELAQVDWLQTVMKDIKPNEEIVSVVTSGDIDSVVVHMFALSLHWHRNQDGTFKNTVYVLLQKAKPEMYNITNMIERMEKHFGFKYAALNIAIVCCMGGNDFLPKLNGMSHEKWMSTFLQIPDALRTILSFEEYDADVAPCKAWINSSVYHSIIKHMYCPKGILPSQLTIDEVRQMSIKMPGKDFRHPTSWMPPPSAIESLIKLLNCQLEYMFTVWDHSAELPTFLGRGCLIKDENGDVSYDFGAGCRTDNKEDLLIIDENCLLDKIKLCKRSQKRCVSIDTPEKNATRKRRPVMSTPKKKKDSKPPVRRSLDIIHAPSRPIVKNVSTDNDVVEMERYPDIL
ncbi:uncharacterized protein LOC123551536 [Mercenaria mercenaria]|uniref:uncharacterized protein LOC123551536 n=1 Tax=Mercenaria mercenaria TaxID=6596 RepID=UPI00234F5D19|nr:uncharacterized protein LOC123551536 [Mercenaria mercenaria]